ncbi:nuclease domain-containing protein [Clostridium estertheticum]|uniref:nuclease domain-containing protein n=1 Tax=Clostridium estertheticum TaxID=238834 RepID=UPI0021F438A8|nr:nuclease domain-containing protein [Clostridium estertheticum]
MASGYSEIYKYYLMLQKGLSINSNIFSLSMKELSLLYEYWCFIKINSLLRKRYKLISTDFITINRGGIFVSLKKGVTSTLVYENPNTKETFKVSYNAIKSRKASNLGSRTEGSKTVTQKPDNMLSINKLGSDKAYEFVFDAKYKIDT